jgi:succinate dehydrogenase/fumarate reductase flavoprotein subunit
MQHNVGIVREEKEMEAALEHLEMLWERAGTVGVGGNA